MVEVYDNQGGTPVRIDGANSTGELPVTFALVGTPVILGTESNAVNTTLGTVPANKKWYILQARVAAGTSDTNSGDFQVSLQVNGVNLVGVSINEAATGQATSPTMCSNFTYPYCPVATAGQVIRTNNANGIVLMSAGIVYVEVAV